MGLFIGCRGREIQLVADSCPPESSFEIIEVDDSYREYDPSDLIKNFEVRRGRIVPKSLVDHANLRIAFVGVYRIPCGISTYSEWLWSEMAPLVKEYRIFAEEIVGAVAEPNVVRCWKRGQPLTELTKAIRDYDPDVIYIQHEYGVFPVARHWLSFIASLQDIRTVVTLHSVYRHKDKTICEAALSDIVVHSNSAKDILAREKQIHGNINVIYHGSFPCESEHKYWNLYQSNHTIVQFGFGFKYKGWERAIETVALLKEKYSDVFFTGLFSETPTSREVHDHYFMELNELIDRLGVRENVAMIRGFQSEECLDSYLRTNNVALFPYIPNGEHTVHGCSGAARYAMSRGVPVIVSDVPQFADLEGVVARCANPSEMAEAIERIFENKDPGQMARQNKFLVDNSWKVAARKHFEILNKEEL